SRRQEARHQPPSISATILPTPVDARNLIRFAIAKAARQRWSRNQVEHRSSVYSREWGTTHRLPQRASSRTQGLLFDRSISRRMVALPKESSPSTGANWVRPVAISPLQLAWRQQQLPRRASVAALSMRTPSTA